MLLRITLLLACLWVLNACANDVPQELSRPAAAPLEVDTHPGNDADDLQRACADTMLAYSPVDHATDVHARAISQENDSIVIVQAVLLGLSRFDPRLPVTYRCDYHDGRLVRGRWLQGLSD